MQPSVSQIIPDSDSFTPAATPKKFNLVFVIIILTILLLFSIVINIYLLYQAGKSHDGIQPIDNTSPTPTVTQAVTTTATPEPTGSNTTQGALIHLKLVTQDWASMPGPNGSTSPVFDPVTSTITINQFEQEIPLKSFNDTNKEQVKVIQYDNYAAVLQFSGLRTNPQCYPMQSGEPCTMLLRKGGSIKMNTTTVDAGTNYTLSFE